MLQGSGASVSARAGPGQQRLGSYTARPLLRQGLLRVAAEPIKVLSWYHIWYHIWYHTISWCVYDIICIDCDFIVEIIKHAERVLVLRCLGSVAGPYLHLIGLFDVVYSLNHSRIIHTVGWWSSGNPAVVKLLTSSSLNNISSYDIVPFVVIINDIIYYIIYDMKYDIIHMISYHIHYHTILWYNI